MANISAIKLPDNTTYDIKDNVSGYITGMTILSYGSSTWNDFITAYNSNRVVYCRASSNSNPASGSQTRLAFMAYVNNATTPTSVEFQYYRSVSTHSDSQQGDQVYVYTLTSAGTWSVTTREAYSKINVGGSLSKSYASGTITLSAPERGTAASGGTTLSVVNTGDMYTWNQKQDALVSGTNIKTINNTSLLGSGNLDISSSGEAENITQAEYDALTPAQKSDGTIYFIYDGTPTPGPTPVSNLQNLVDGSATASVRGVGTAGESGSYTMGTYAFAEGRNTKAKGTSSHAEGYQAIASGSYSHAEGHSTEAEGSMSHAEGSGSQATGDTSHAEGAITTASGNYGSHAEGYNTVASGQATHAQNLGTTAQRKSQTALGEYNVADTAGTTASRGDYAVIVGNGTADNARSNALTVDWSGNVDIASGAHYKINGSNLSASDIGALPNTTVIPTKTSDLTNDSGYITTDTFTAIYGTTTFDEIKTAYNAGKRVIVHQTLYGADICLSLVGLVDKRTDPDFLYAEVIFAVNVEADLCLCGIKVAEDLENSGQLVEAWYNKFIELQSKLVSGDSIKTINNQSLLGSGNISIQSEPEIFIATYGVTTYAAVAAAYTAGKTIYCKYTQTFSEATVDSFFPLICMSNNIIGGDSFIVYSFGTSGNGETVRVTLSELPPYWHLEEVHETQIIRWTEVV